MPNRVVGGWLRYSKNLEITKKSLLYGMPSIGAFTKAQGKIGIAGGKKIAQKFNFGCNSFDKRKTILGFTYQGRFGYSLISYIVHKIYSLCSGWFI